MRAFVGKLLSRFSVAIDSLGQSLWHKRRTTGMNLSACWLTLGNEYQAVLSASLHIGVRDQE